MRIAILAERMLPGCLPKITSEEARYLRKRGHKVDVITIMGEGLTLESYQFQEFLHDIPIRELSKEFPLGKCFAFKLPFFSFLSGYHLMGPLFVPHLIKREEYDVIIALNSLTCLTAYQIWRRWKIHYVAYVWDPFSYILAKVYSQRLPKAIFLSLLKVALWLDRLIVENSLVTITLSQPHADLLRSLTDKKDIEIVYLGCNPVECIPERRGGYLLAIDRWDRGNMPHILLEIMERLKGKANLIVAGFCSERWVQESFIKLRAEKGLTERVRWLGPVNEEKLKKLYLGARAWIHPIEETSVSIPALEAAGHGCPIVMPKWTPLFSHRVHGFFPTEGDLDEYAEYVDILLDDERLAWKMGHEAWKVAKKYRWEYHAKCLEEIIMKYVNVN